MRRYIDYFNLATARSDSAPHTRSLVFTRTWSRYYRFPDFYIDLAFSGNRYGAVLQGYYYQRAHGFVQPTSLIFMHKTEDLILTEMNFEADAPFRFMATERGEYQLIAESGEDVFEVETLRI